MPLMNCAACGHQISVHAEACPSCGHPVPTNRFVRHAAPARRRSDSPEASGAAIGALLCGVTGIVMLFTPLVWLMAGVTNLLGAIFGVVGVGQVRRGESGGWGMSVTGLLMGLIGLGLYGGMWIVAQDLGPVTTFNDATVQLHAMLTTTGNDDADVLAACSAVEGAYKQVDVSKVSQEQADDMKRVVLAAELWKNQLTLMKVSALQAQLGQNNARAVATDMEIGRLTFPAIRSDVENYVKKYD